MQQFLVRALRLPKPRTRPATVCMVAVLATDTRRSRRGTSARLAELINRLMFGPTMTGKSVFFFFFADSLSAGGKTAVGKHFDD